MSVQLERLSENKVKLTVEVSAAEFDLALDKAFEKVVKEVKADGFRPGKMPKSIFINRYGWASLYNDALQFVFEETYPKAELLVHPECSPEVTELADYAGSTKGIIDYAAASECEEFIIGTEVGVMYQLKKKLK